jgi:WW domain-containing oxidoreductase
LTKAANAILAAGKPIDAFVANAGIAAPPKLASKYGVELQFLVNHVAHFARITRLERAMTEHTGRIVMVSSHATIKQRRKWASCLTTSTGISYTRLSCSVEMKLSP